MTERYAVVGNPVEHSLSPVIHTAFARETGQAIEYGRLLAPLDGFRATVEAFRRAGGRGLNVTVPFKGEAWELSEPRDAAIEAQAVNTLVFGDGSLLGYNTDGVGLVRDLRQNLGVEVAGRRVLVMGAGGATRGVVGPLLREAPGAIVVANRTVERATALAAYFLGADTAAAGRIRGCGYEAVQNGRFDLVINATSAGLSGEMPELPDEVFAPGAVAYEMVYGRDTPFLHFARARGVRTADGLGMLVEQAAESFRIWRGVRPATAPVIRMLREQTRGSSR